jgi:4'-phosphopantetheinyl transferase
MTVQCDLWWAEPAETARAIDLLDEIERNRYEAFRRPEDRQRFATARLLAKTAAAARLGKDPADIKLVAKCPRCAEPHGKPTVDGAELELSISHSGSRIMVATTQDAPVGVDVEQTDRPNTDIGLLARSVLNEAELTVFDAVPAAGRERAFFTYWTRKEALLKSTGDGLNIGMTKLTVSGPDAAPELLHWADGPRRIWLADLDPGHGYAAALAVITTDDVVITTRQFVP